MKKKLYAAYGSNLNLRQMAYRCPTARLVGTGVIPGYELQFKGRDGTAFATIAPKEGAEVPVGVWMIQPKDELALDRYEGYPSHYFKQNVPVQMDGRELLVMAYIMDLRMGFGRPSPMYYETVRTGYEDCGLDPQYLKTALETSVRNCLDAFDAQEDDPEMEMEEVEDEGEAFDLFMMM